MIAASFVKWQRDFLLTKIRQQKFEEVFMRLKRMIAFCAAVAVFTGAYFVELSAKPETDFGLFSWGENIFGRKL